MKKKLNFMPVIIKAQRVIDSCKTVEQLRVARKYNRLVQKWMGKQIKKNGGILNNIDDYESSLDIMWELTDKVHDKAKEMDVLL